MTKNHLHNSGFSTDRAHEQYTPAYFNADVQGNVFMWTAPVFSVTHCLKCKVMNAEELYSDYLIVLY